MAVEWLPFPAQSWQDSPTNAREQKKTNATGRVALLRFAPGFTDEAGCRRAHALYVVSGVLELRLDDSVCRVGPGEACRIDAGTAHWARNPGPDVVEVFVVSDI